MLWESSHEDYLDKLGLPCFVCTLSPRLGDGSVTAILGVLWAMLRPRSLEEKIGWGCAQQWPKGFFQQYRYAGPILVGDDPFLCARKVSGLRVQTTKSGEEELRFVIPAEYAMRPGDKDFSLAIPARPMVLRQGERHPQPYPDDRS